jgi:hypothetical protein
MMTDAELMTTEPDVPGLEVRLYKTVWDVRISEETAGLVSELHGPVGGIYRFRADANTYIKSFPTRNEAVQWILDQHKGEAK